MMTQEEVYNEVNDLIAKIKNIQDDLAEFKIHAQEIGDEVINPFDIDAINNIIHNTNIMITTINDRTGILQKLESIRVRYSF